MSTTIKFDSTELVKAVKVQDLSYLDLLVGKEYIGSEPSLICRVTLLGQHYYYQRGIWGTEEVNFNSGWVVINYTQAEEILNSFKDYIGEDYNSKILANSWNY